MDVVVADLNNDRHEAGILHVLDSYAADPIGGGEPLSPGVRARLIPGLRAHPTTLVLLAFEGENPIGIAVCFFGFSTFRASPLLNIHDLAVIPERRGEGVGRILLDAVEKHARERACCKLTLEAQQSNGRALTLYRKFGFEDFTLGDSGPTQFFAKTLA